MKAFRHNTLYECCRKEKECDPGRYGINVNQVEQEVLL